MRRAALVTMIALTAPASAHAAHGALDPAFSGDGRTTINFSDLLLEKATAVVRQSSGRLVTAGSAMLPSRPDPSDAGERVLLVGVRSDGNALDSSFGGGDGRVVTHFGGLDGEHATSLLRLPDEKLLVSGEVDANPEGLVEPQMMLLRYTPDGAPDTTFGSNGGRRIQFPEGTSTANDVTRLPDGRLVVVGQVRRPVGGGTEAAVARLSADGKTLDTTFNGTGRLLVRFTTATGDQETLQGVIPQSDGGVVAIGSAAGRLGVVRLKPNGTLDPSFGVAGRVLLGAPTGTAEFGQAIARVGDRYVISGTRTVADEAAFLVGRLQLNGALDSVFGLRQGDFSPLTPTGDSIALGRAMLVTADAGAVVAGDVHLDRDPIGPPRANFGLARFDAFGRLSPTFDGDGLVLNDFPFDNEELEDLAPGPDGFFVAAGEVDNYLSDGSVDTRIILARYHGIPDERRPGLRARLHGRRLVVRCDEAAAVTVRHGGRTRELDFDTPGRRVLRLRGARGRVVITARDHAGNRRRLTINHQQGEPS